MNQINKSRRAKERILGRNCTFHPSDFPGHKSLRRLILFLESMHEILIHGIVIHVHQLSVDLLRYNLSILFLHCYGHF